MGARLAMGGRMAESYGQGRTRGGASFVLDQLRDEILSLTLKPGTVLSRAELQERFELSSTPIRDALMRLQEEGLVDIFPQHATVVTAINTDHARQAQFLRRSVELELVHQLALAPDDALIEQLRSLIRQQSAFADLGEHEAFSRADHAFHQQMYIAAEVAGLWHLVRRQSGHIDRLRRLNLPVEGKMHEIVRAHTAIVDAIAAQDPAGAQEALRHHLSRSIGLIDVLRERNPDYFK